MSQSPYNSATLMTGIRIGRLVLRQKVRRGAKFSSAIRLAWVCDCDCGNRHTVPQGYFTRGNPKQNCGMCKDLQTNKTKYNNEFRIWLMMHRRCYDPKHVSWEYYGKRGIIVEEPWHDFEQFLSDMGGRPSKGHSLDRYPDPDGPYTKSNVRWATAEQQANNKSKLYPPKPRRYTHDVHRKRKPKQSKPRTEKHI